MSKSLYRLPFIAAALIIAGGLLTWASAKTDWDQEARKRKAEYIFLESQSAYSAGQYDKYISLINRAYQLDSNDIDIAGEWAMIELMDDNADSAHVARAYGMLSRRFHANPSNFYNGVLLANIAKEQGKYYDVLDIWKTLDSISPTRPDVAIELAKAYLYTYMIGDTANFDKAMGIYNRIQSGTGRTIELTSQKTTAYYLKGDTAAVIAELDSLYAFAPNDSYTAQFIGANYDYMKMPELAIKYYDLACELDPANGSAYLQRAQLYHSQGDSIGFDREVFHALKSQNLDIESKIDILRSYVSELYTDSTQEPRIRQLFNDLQLMHAGEPEIHSLYGAYLYERKDYAGAAEQLSYVTALSPNDESAWSMYTQMLGLDNDTTAIKTVVREAMAKFPDNLYFPLVLSSCYRICDDLPQAKAVLDSVDITTVNNERAVSNFLLSKADLYTLVGDTIGALEIYDSAIKLNPDNTMALNNAAYFIALTGGDLNKAERYSARSLQNDELNSTYLDTYAWIFFLKKDYTMAKHYIDIALNSYENEITGAPTTITPDEDLTDGATTDDIAQDIVEVEEEAVVELSADIYDHAGDIYFMNGEIDKALEFWEKSHEIDPTDTLVEKKVKNKTIFFR